MGNNNSNDVYYDIDTELINTEHISDNKNNSMIVRYDKIFITYKSDKYIYFLLLKIVSNKLYIYIKNTLNNEKKLLKIIVVSKNSNINAKCIDYIYISKEYDIISIPEYDVINIYSLSKLIDNSKLVQVNRTHLSIGYDTNDIILYYNNNKICQNTPHKIHLNNDIIILTLSTQKECCKIIGIDYNKNMLYTIDNIDIDINTSDIHISNNTVLLYDNRHMIRIIDIKNEDIKNEDIKNGIIKNTLCLSDDGNLVFYVEDDVKNINFITYNINDKIYNSNVIDKQEISGNLRDIHFKVFNYDRFINMYILDDNNVYILTGWDIKHKKLYYWILKYNSMCCLCHGYKCIDMNINDNIIYNYNNRFIYIFKTDKGTITYDLEKIIPIKIADMMKNNILKDIDNIYQNNKHKAKKYIDIKSADNKIKRYQLNNITNMFINCDKNIYDVEHTVNIDIYNNNKSFDIFKKLLENTNNIDNIIVDIFKIESETNRYNIMYDLMEHIYEFIKTIIINDNNDIISELKAYYIGFILMIFILKFYTYLIKKNRNISIKKDIIDNFNNNFQPFNNFMNTSIRYLL